MKSEKIALRKDILLQMESFEDAYVAHSDAGIFENLRNLPEFIAAETVFSYYSLGREPDTIRLLELALEMGKTVTLPVCFKGGVMEARAVESLGQLSKTGYGLLEPLDSSRVVPPENLDFIVVPALAFDVYGYRLGRGGGYYDRYLPAARGFTAGVARERLLYDRLPRQAHDVPVDCVVTEKEARPRQESR